jgi:hypothetical protein
MYGLPDVAVGAVAAALVVGLVSLLALIISKEQKVSEFRQAWIDGLRKELALLIAHANAIFGAGMVHFNTTAEHWKVVRFDFAGINNAVARIRLRLNPKEKESEAILSEIEVLERLLAPGQAMNHVEINATEKRLVEKAQVVLKTEWRRVRRGETVYRSARVAALVVSVGSVVALIWSAVARFTQ